MHLGFTGSRDGMDSEQLGALRTTIELIDDVCTITNAHHGDCLGADSEFHVVVLDFNPKIIRHAHPCDLENQRFYCELRDIDICHDPLPPLERNQVIVDSSDFVIGAPRESQEVVRSGTWATIRRARKAGNLLCIVYPNGEVDWKIDLFEN